MRLTQRHSARRSGTRCSLKVERLEDRMTPATLLPGFSESTVASGLTRPTAMELSPDGKLFIAEQDGTMEVWQNGSRLQANFFSNDPITVGAAGERGLLGIAFDPDYEHNNFVYVYYTATSPAVHNRVSRFTADADAESTLALANSETIIFELNNLSSATNHNGGAIHFGPDGKLYIATGDNANSANAQTLNNLLGKILRINADGSIPDNNPFSTATGQNKAIWAMGLRNPYTFAFSDSGTMYINDVGQSTWEEINVGAAGANYNWPNTEGPFTPPATNPKHLTPPTYAYKHGGTAPSGIAITGGAFYDPSTGRFPVDYFGDYFFADYGGGWIYRYDIATDSVTLFADDISAPVDLRTGDDGSMFYLERGTGSVKRIQADEGPNIVQQPQSATVAEGVSPTFTVVAAGAPTITYQWQEFVSGSWTNMASQTAASLALNSVDIGDNGRQFRVIVHNGVGEDVTSNVATLSVFINQLPNATITSPTAGALYSAGRSYSFAGTANDAESGLLPASAFTWWVDFHHGSTVTNFLPERSGVKSGSFVIPNTGNTATDVFYRIHLRVQDGHGAQTEVVRDFNPRLVQITLQSNVAGAQIVVDGQSQTTPIPIPSVVGMIRNLSAAAQNVNGIDYTFRSWSNRKAANHTFVTGTANATYKANFTAVAPGWAYQINFQPTGRPIPSGYLADTGAVFGDRGGLNYGWNVNMATYARDRNLARSPDQRYDTVVLMQPTTSLNAYWEIEVPNGDYQVHVVAGDPSTSKGNYQILVENTLAIDGKPVGSNWLEAVVTVTVSDGRLRISSGANASMNRLAFVDINPVSPGAPAASMLAATDVSSIAPASITSTHIVHDWVAELAEIAANKRELISAFWQAVSEVRNALALHQRPDWRSIIDAILNHT